ncbi:MAG: phosphotransferase [Gemmatimonadota bacterium]
MDHPLAPRIVELFEAHFGAPPEERLPVSADGSARRYWRLIGRRGETAIGAYGPDPEENRAFLAFSRAFRSIDLPVPEIYAADEEAGVWLEEDLGDATLFDLLDEARRHRREGGEGRREPEEVPGGPPGEAGSAPGGSAGAGAPADFPPAIEPLYRRVLEVLPRFQAEGAEVVDFGLAYPHAAFDRQSLLWDLNYFKYHFLKLARIPFHEARLEKDFRRLVRFLRKADSTYFLYRDFQSRNIMLREEAPWFIDYQGGRRGALQYDVASLLYDAKADLPGPLREALLGHYLTALEHHVQIDRDLFLERYPGFVLVRLMQALGAYGYRGFYERKPHFLQSVPYAARTLSGLLEAGLPRRLPELEAAFRRIAEGWADRSPGEWRSWPELSSAAPPPEPRPVPGPRGRSGTEAVAAASPRLTVHVGSFSFRGGYPEEVTGHGGGFVFDCRALPNPGREEVYLLANGLDPEVQAYLDARPETRGFWDSVRALVDAQVRSFLGRGFTELTVRFGCTGGQHRSVYFAERLAAHLRASYPELEVEVTHRERERWPASDAGTQRNEVDRSGAAPPGSESGCREPGARAP